MVSTHISIEPPAIGDYALLGDCRSLALVSRDGSIDWLCLPRPDSPSVFGALLDPALGGRFRIRPLGGFETQRRYVPDTNVLETVFQTESGSCLLRDLIPVRSEEDKRLQLLPEHHVLREMRGLSGTVTLRIEYQPRPRYGLLRPRLRRRGALGLWCEVEGAVLILNSEVPLELDPDGTSAGAIVELRPGDRRFACFSYAGEAPAVVHPLGEVAARQVEQSIHWWRGWAARCTYAGPYREHVVRSALALKLMSYAPSGAVLAAPTTSLPEQIGGQRNWDYRYCWLRDAAFTLRALLDLGFEDEAGAFMAWMLHATRLTRPELRVLYDVYGGTELEERELHHLSGYRDSLPVRIGNDARHQLQLDVYGEVVDAAALLSEVRGRFDSSSARMLADLGRTVCRRWREPDEGIWEIRSGRRRHTHSNALCWLALDRLLQMHAAGYITLTRPEVARFREHRQAIRQEIETRGYNAELESYVRTFDGDELDASLLVLPLLGYVAADDPRMRSSFARIRDRLARGNLYYRYALRTDDGLPPGEGAFGVCSFWAVECLARQGDLPQAEAAFEDLLGYANDLGLFAEEIDPETRAQLGNFPQAFTHVGLINAALTIEQCAWRGGGTEPGRPPAALARAG